MSREVEDDEDENDQNDEQDEECEDECEESLRRRRRLRDGKMLQHIKQLIQDRKLNEHDLIKSLLT